MKESFKGSQPLPKITRPKVQHEVLRRRLFRRLDAAIKKPLLWIASPAGSGKTTLVSSYIRERNLPCLWYRCDEGDGDPATFFHYMAMAADKANSRRRKRLPALTPEFLPSLSVFTRRYFQDLCARISPPFLIVLDNHQAVPSDSYYHEILLQGLDVLPERVTMVVISRNEPAPPFARLSAYNKMEILNWADVRFTLEETAAVVKAGRRGKMTRETLREVHQRTDGWVAAIVLMLERVRLRGEASAFPGEVAFEGVFRHFADEILDHMAPETRAFLLKTAFIPTISVQAAEELTGSENAGRILSALSRQNYFTQRLSGAGQEYQYHPLFRASLMARAKSEFAPPALSALIAKAAQIQTRSGRVEEAASLFAEIGDWEGLEGLLLQEARVFIHKGRNKTLESFLRRIPAGTLGASPWMLYWLGICRMPFDLEESRAFLEKAFDLFNDKKDVAGAFATWAAVVDSIITEHNDYTKLDPWIKWLDGWDELPESLPLEIRRETVAYMLFAITFRTPWDPKASLWVERAEEILRSGADLAGTMIVGARLLLHYTFSGEVHKADLLLKNIQPPEAGAVGMRILSLIQWQVILAGFAALGSASADTCLEIVRRGLALSREHGIAVFEPLLLYFGAFCCIVSGDDASADKFLAEMVSLRGEFNEMQLAYYISLHAWRDLIKGDARSAAERIGMILPVTDKFGHTINSIANHIGLSHALFDLGERGEARAHLAEARALHRVGSPWSEYMILATEAYFAFREGREGDGLELTRRAMALSRESGVAVFVYWRPALLALLCSKALEAGIETGYVAGLIRKLGLRPENSQAGLENWPWPVRIYTMGRFQVLRDGVPLEFSRKTPQKPLELLKCLIAFGGRDVAEERVADALWPECDGDHALQSLEITLRRLRGLLGADDSVKHGARTLSINAHHCWVDSLALAQAMESAADPQSEPVERQFRLATKLYRGDFLPAEFGRDWAVSRRETLRAKMLRLAERAARLHEQRGEWERAADCYHKGIEVESLAETLYRRLMMCYRNLGERAEAIRAYHRCRSLLQSQLGVGPSPATEAMYSSLLEK